MRGGLLLVALFSLAACGPSARTCKQDSDCSSGAMCDLTTHYCALVAPADSGTGGGSQATGGGSAGGGSVGGGGGTGGTGGAGGSTGGGGAIGGGSGGGGALGGGGGSDGGTGGGGAITCVPSCDAGQECFDGGCRCSTTSCTGCCAGEVCQPGSDPAACGANGNACSTCNTGDSCSGGACQGCVISCAQGCCAGNTCNTASATTCGIAGAACADCTPRGDTCDAGTCGCGAGGECASGQHCDAGQCACDPSSCPAGCCNGANCTLYAGQSATQCGTSGLACAACDPNSTDTCTNGVCTCGAAAACSPGQRCSGGQCVCDGTSCGNGCCTALVGGTCVSYGSESSGQCGAGGALCASCASGQRCNGSGQCVCDANSCANGCCTATVGGTCVAYSSETTGQCGAGGALCAACGAGQHCNASGQCVCDATTCLNGCCTATVGGSCVAYGSESNGQCGAAGAVCAACSASQHCNASGQCVCDSSTCLNGCCTATVGGACVPYASQTNGQCGASGGVCSACNSSDHCSGGQCTCDSTSCPGGCCTSTIGGTCVPFGSETNGQCGVAGAQCAACLTNQRCITSGGNTGHCVCDGTSCTAGCCSQTIGGLCVPYASESNGLCGAAGAICGGCASGQRCNGSGQCICDATSCANGCCTATVGGTCVGYGSETNGQCGAGGAICGGCASGQRCNGSGQCICDGTSCPGGCCSATLNGTCNAGTANTACGISGNLCSDCSLSTCNRCRCVGPPANLICACAGFGTQAYVCESQACVCDTSNECLGC